MPFGILSKGVTDLSDKLLTAGTESKDFKYVLSPIGSVKSSADATTDKEEESIKHTTIDLPIFFKLIPPNTFCLIQ
ncbi:hypothetical protein D3C73_800750 [compost metagenome]